jgi:hypothetical protein
VPLIPHGVAVPREHEIPNLRFEALGPALHEDHFELAQESQDRIRQTPGFPYGVWREDEDYTEDDDLAELRRLSDAFDRREEFAYLVTQSEYGDAIGVVHIGPPEDGRPGVALRSWVNPHDGGLDAPLHLAARDWVESWGVVEVTSPGRKLLRIDETATARPVTVLPEFRSDTAVERVTVSWPGQAVVVARGGTTVSVHNIDTGRTAAFPAPRAESHRYGFSVSPSLSVAVIHLPHVVRAVTPDGAVLWEYSTRCDDCGEKHPDDRPNCTRRRGSAQMSADGSLVWIHARTQDGVVVPRAYNGKVLDYRLIPEEWLVLDAASGEILARTPVRTFAEGSWHVTHPDPSRMCVIIGEGQDGVETVRGHWKDGTLSTDTFGDGERGLEAVSPSGETLLWLSHGDDAIGWNRDGGTSRPGS